METKTAKAVANYIRTSPRKVRKVVDLIRGKMVADAMAILKYQPVKSASDVVKVLKSAVANAENNYQMNAAELYVKTCFVDQGPSIKRMSPRAMGRADVIKRRTSHVTIEVAEKPFKPQPVKKAAAKAAPTEGAEEKSE